jgi:Secretion system C-terminal sorting domain
MKRMLLAIISALSISASAQITITNAVFPTIGDTLRYVTDNSPQGIDAATPPGGNQIWNFGGLKRSTTFQTAYTNANKGVNFSKFPGADLAIINQQGESYFNKTTTNFENMGFVGRNQAAFNIVLLAKYSPVLVERKAPLNFFDIAQQTSNLNIPFDADELPDTLLQNLPIKPDSIRVRINNQRLEVVDGWGSCSIPGGTYPVLRQKRTEYVTTGIDIKVPFLGWLDLSTVGGGGSFGGLIGTDTTVSYRFLNDKEKEEIAVVTLNNAQNAAQTVRFKNNNVLLSAPEFFAPGNSSIQAFPNPAVEWVRFDCNNLQPGEYTLKIFNIVGRAVFKETYQIAGNRSIRIELEDFKKGTYLYSLSDAKGNVIGTKRLVVLKP